MRAGTDAGTSSDRTGRAPELSVVAPVYFEEECVGEFVRRVGAVLDAAKFDAEILLVDDGSTDRTVSKVLELMAGEPRLRLVELAYNHGKPFALTAGAAYARGGLVLFMDPDLQDPPEAIPEFVAKAREGFDLVLSTREHRAESFVSGALARAFWWSLRRFTGLPIPNDLGTMRICSRAFIDRFLEYPEANRFVEGIFLHVGMRRTSIVVPHRERFAGRTKFGLRRRISLAATAITAFSDAPLRLMVKAGLVLTLLGVASIAGLVLARLFLVEFQLGWPSLFGAIVAGVGINLLFLGVIGTYVGNIYREVKRRPLFAVRAVHEAEPAA